MTKIYLHGILEKEYQKFFCLNLKNASDLIEAIDCNRQGFKARLIQLQNKCCFYDVIINKKRIKSFKDLKEEPKRIDLVPAIAGAGPFAAIIGAFGTALGTAVTFAAQAITTVGSAIGQGFQAITSGLTKGLTNAFGAGAGAGGAGSAAAGGAAAAKGAGIFSHIATSVGLAAIGAMLAPKPDLGLPAQQKISAQANAYTQSYIFSSKINLAQQGSFLPIGYGRLKVGSAVIQSSIKSFPLIVPDQEALQSNSFISKSAASDPIIANSFV